MALNAQALGSAMANAVLKAAKDENVTPQQIYTAMATEIINHIKNNAQVSVTVTTAGTATAQSGSGTGTIL